jgi:acyl-coenzyme A synthetase/AMP-(fatty) acid ligase
MVHFVPSMLQAFLDEPHIERCSSLRRVICSGEALPFDLQQRFFARMSSDLLNLYGPTEAAVEVSAWICQRSAERRSIPIGRSITNTRLYVLDQVMQPVPVGVAGELYIGGVQVGRGYWRRPSLTAERFVPDPFAAEPGQRLYRTGDLARWTADGVLEYLGRLDSQVKLRGFRIELGEIEAALAQHTSVREAAVSVRSDGPAGQPCLVAYVVPVAGPSPTADVLRDHLRQCLPEYMLPSAFVTLDLLPLSGSGKLDRSALPAPRLDLTEVQEEPGTEAERVVAAVFCGVLDRAGIGRQQSFFEAGGHSLLAARAVARLRGEFGVDLPLADFFATPTVAGVASTIQDRLLARLAAADFDALLDSIERDADGSAMEVA